MLRNGIGRTARAVLAWGALAASVAVAQVGKNAGVANPNLATEAELRALPQVDDAVVKVLLAGRPYLRVRDLDAALVPALPAEKRAALYARLFVPIDLNAASREEIALVPGVGKRMVHEFLEYRPYRHLTVFRKEIGKYVDAEEVARLEQYVFVPVPLDTASDEDILSIPGVGPKLLQAFKEHRPYRDLEQFRSEIGKHVGAEEVARLATYVTFE